jgi:hypothetical protein
VVQVVGAGSEGASLGDLQSLKKAATNNPRGNQRETWARRLAVAAHLEWEEKATALFFEML